MKVALALLCLLVVACASPQYRGRPQYRRPSTAEGETFAEATQGSDRGSNIQQVSAGTRGRVTGNARANQGASAGATNIRGFGNSGSNTFANTFSDLQTFDNRRFGRYRRSASPQSTAEGETFAEATQGTSGGSNIQSASAGTRGRVTGNARANQGARAGATNIRGFGNSGSNTFANTFSDLRTFDNRRFGRFRRSADPQSTAEGETFAEATQGTSGGSNIQSVSAGTRGRVTGNGRASQGARAGTTNIRGFGSSGSESFADTFSDLRTFDNNRRFGRFRRSAPYYGGRSSGRYQPSESFGETNANVVQGSSHGTNIQQVSASAKGAVRGRGSSTNTASGSATHVNTPHGSANNAQVNTFSNQQTFDNGGFNGGFNNGFNNGGLNGGYRRTPSYRPRY